jgi:hypothetical protein
LFSAAIVTLNVHNGTVHVEYVVSDASSVIQRQKWRETAENLCSIMYTVAV